ncbi:MAG: complement resistance protein TraT [Desulfovibrio sp.]|nr:complement resistance protein TraT [Desulfovibrio sp.]
MTRYLISCVMALCLMCAGCSAMQVALTRKDLDVQTKMSSTIFMDLENQKGRHVYVDFRNTSGKNLNLENMVTQTLISRGYETVSSPAKADYILQVNVLSCEKSDPAAIEKNLGLGFGTALTGVATGALIGTATHSSYGMATGAVVGGLAGSAAELVAGSLVKDVTYALVTDVQVTEKTRIGKNVHRTRMASTANKVNLKYEDAQYPLEEAMANSIAGIF